MKKTAFVVLVEETYRREVVVYADDAFEAEELVEEQCNDGTIDLDGNDFESRNVRWVSEKEEK